MTMKKLALLFGLLLAAPAFAADNAVIVTPGTGVTMKSKDIGAGVQAMQPILSDTGGNALSTPTAGADGASNTATGLLIYNRNIVWNGTTWDRWTGDLTAGAWVNLKASAIIGTTADAPCTLPASTTPCSVIAIEKATANAANGSIPAGTAIIGKVGIDQTTPGTTNGVTPTDGTNTALVDPCQSGTKAYTPINIVTAANTKIVTGTAAKKTYICGLFLYPAAADNIAIIEGSGVNCATSPLGLIGGATAATGIVATAQAGFILPTTGYAHAASTVNANDFCLITSAAVQLSGVAVTVAR